MTDNTKKYHATYEIEVCVPLYDPEDNLLELDIATKIIEEAGELDGAGAGFGLRDAEGSADFESPVKALEWKERITHELLTKYPKADYPEIRPSVFVGLRLYDREGDDDGFYTDLICNKDGQHFAKGEDDEGKEVFVPLSEIEIESVEYLTVDIKNTMAKAEEETIKRIWG